MRFLHATKTSFCQRAENRASTSGKQKFMFVNHVQRCSNNAVGSAADRIAKSNFHGRCGTLNYHTDLNVFKSINKMLPGVKDDRPHGQSSPNVGF